MENNKFQIQDFNFRIKKSTLLIFISLFLYQITLDISYYFMISKVWYINKLILNINYLKLSESFFLLFFIFLFIPKETNKLSNIIVWLLVLISYVPMLTLFALMDQPRVYMYTVSIFWIIVSLLLYTPDISIPRFNSNQTKILNYSIFFCFSTIVFILIYLYLGIPYNIDLEKVYEIRKAYTELKIPLSGYLFNWLAYIINPLFFAMFLTKKKWVLVGLISFLQFLLFSTTGDKTFLFALIFVLVLMFAIKQKNPIIWLSFGLIGIILLGILSYWFIDDIWITSLFARRTLILPAQLSFFYYDFFSNNSFTYMSQLHFFNHFSNYQYNLDPPHLISVKYFNKPNCSSNNGIYGDAYMNFGIIGIFLWAFLLAFILKLYDSVSKKSDMKISVAAIAMPVIALTNSALFTNLITHGLLLSILLIYLLEKKKVINE